MPDAHYAAAAEPSADETVLMEWTVHLLRREPKRAAGVAAAALLAAALGGWLFHSVLFALLGALLIVGATAEYLFPIRYRLTTMRACASYGLARLEMEWGRVRRVDRAPGMVKLSPFAVPNRLDGIRGIVLRCDDLQESAILGLVEKYGAAPTAISSTEEPAHA